MRQRRAKERQRAYEALSFNCDPYDSLKNEECEEFSKPINAIYGKYCKYLLTRRERASAPESRLIIGTFLINGAQYSGQMTKKQPKYYKIFLKRHDAALPRFTFVIV